MTAPSNSARVVEKEDGIKTGIREKMVKDAFGLAWHGLAFAYLYLLVRINPF